MTDNATTNGQPAVGVIGDRSQSVDSVLLARIAGGQLARGIETEQPCLLLNVDDDGTRLDLIDPQAEVTLAHRSAPEIRPSELDRMLAEHLVRIGRVDKPITGEESAELVAVVGHGRELLASYASTTLSGWEYVGEFPLTRDDLAAATGPQIDEVARLAAETAASSSTPAGSMVLDRGPAVWPVLATELERRSGLPVIPLAPDPDATDQAYDYAYDQNGYAYDEYGYAYDENGYAYDEYGYAYDENGYAYDEYGYAYDENGYAYDHHYDYGADNADYVDDHGADAAAELPSGAATDSFPVQDAAESEHPEAVDAEDASEADTADNPSPEQQRRTRLLLMAVGALAAVALGAVIAMASSGDDSSNVAAQNTPPSTKSRPTQQYANPAEFTQARVPADDYIPPPPPPPPETQTPSTNNRGHEGGPRQPPPPAPGPVPELPPVPPLPAPPPHVHIQVPGLPPIELP